LILFLPEKSPTVYLLQLMAYLNETFLPFKVFFGLVIAPATPEWLSDFPQGHL